MEQRRIYIVVDAVMRMFLFWRSRRPPRSTPIKSSAASDVYKRQPTGGWSVGEASGIPSVAVKCVDIRRNTSGEGGLLDDD